MDSHITIPRRVFKEFINKNKFYYAYSVKTGHIGKSYPKSTYTQEGYYSDQMERALNRYVEQNLPKLLAFVRDIPNRASPIILSNDLKKIAWTYVRSLIARSPMLHEGVAKDSGAIRLLSEQDQHDVVVDYAMRNGNMDELIDKFELSFISNQTKTEFVIPTRGLYEVTLGDALCIIVPINPYGGIMLKEKGKSIHEYNVGKNELIVLPKGFDDVVDQFNGKAFRVQLQDGIGYVICRDRKLLEKLLKEP